MDKKQLIGKVLGVMGIEPTNDNLIELSSIIDQYDRSAARQASVSEKTAAYLYRDELPYSEELEMKFLGAILLKPHPAMVKVRKLFRDDLFFTPATKMVADVIQHLWDKNADINTQAVIEQLRTTKHGENSNQLEYIGGDMYVEDLVFGVDSWEKAEQFGEALIRYWVKRTMINQASQFIHEMAGAKLDEVHDKRVAFHMLLHDIAKSLDTSYGVVDAYDLSKMLTDKVMKLYEFRKEAGNSNAVVVTGVPTALKEVDRNTGGWQASQLIIIMARPGMGKTGYLLSEVLTAIDAGESILIFSMEMSALDLVKRMFTMRGHMDPDDLRTAKVYDVDLLELQKFTAWLDNKGIFVIDAPARKVSMIREATLSMKAQHNISRVYVDYLQLAKSDDGGNRSNQVDDIARSLKNIAKEANVPVIALSQLSRGVEVRGGSKKPQLSDARDSGGIEEAADVAIGLYRPEYYQIMEDEEGHSLKGIGYVLVLKQREGPLAEIKANFETTTLWKDIEDENDFGYSSSPSILNIPAAKLPEDYEDYDFPWE